MNVDLPEEFTLYWKGSETPYGFVAKTPVPGTQYELLATARHIET